MEDAPDHVPNIGIFKIQDVIDGPLEIFIIAKAKSIFADTVNLCYCKLGLVTPHTVGAEGMKIFDFDNSRLLEKVLSGKELHQKLLLLTKKY